MELCCITGSWRRTNKQVARDVRRGVEIEISKGNGIISGGALGVDYTATQYVLRNGNPESQLRIFLPAPLEIYLTHYHKKAEEGIISHKQVAFLEEQLRTATEISPDIISSLNYKRINKHSYYVRNQKEIDACSHVRAFKVNNSSGVQDTINKAKQQGKKVILRRYKI